QDLTHFGCDGMNGVPPPIPVIFCVDVEPDPRQVRRDAREPWLGYQFTRRYVRELRPRIEALTCARAHFSWFLRMDPQVAEPYGSATWVVDTYRAHMDEIQRAGDEIGVHPHPYRWLERERAWLQDFGDQPWVEDCLAISLEAFATAFGRPCRSLRFRARSGRAHVGIAAGLPARAARPVRALHLGLLPARATRHARDQARSADLGV